MSKPNPTPAKTQKSISSFFTPKFIQNRPDPSSPSASGDPGNLHNAESDKETSEATEASSSNLKRVLEEDMNGGNTGVAERPSKRAKSVVEEEDCERFTLPIANARKPSSTSVVGKSKVSPRTNKYMFSGSSQPPAMETTVEEEPEDEEEKARKAELHRKFVKKLGHPDSFRRNVPEDIEPLEGADDEGEEEEEAPVLVKAKKKGAKTGKLTPMELQVIDIKRNHMDTLLIVEVGYKFKFFGEDARTAAKVLSIVCIPGKFRFDERKPSALDYSSHEASDIVQILLRRILTTLHLLAFPFIDSLFTQRGSLLQVTKLGLFDKRKQLH